MLTPTKCVELARTWLTEEQWKRIVESAIQAAMQGDKNGRDFISKLALPEKIEDTMEIGDEKARVVIFREATEEDFKWVQEDRRKREEALKKDGK